MPDRRAGTATENDCDTCFAPAGVDCVAWCSCDMCDAARATLDGGAERV